MKYKVSVIGLGMGAAWVKAIIDNPDTELGLCYDKNYARRPDYTHTFCETNHVPLTDKEEAIYASDSDIMVIASPDHFHVEQSVKALEAGKHVACEKPLAPTVAECRKIISAVKKSGKFFMTGQVCRYAPGFRMAKYLYDLGRIGDLVYIESEYAHDYELAKGFDNWRMDAKVKREGFLGGGCHALDLTRWIAGDPLEVFAYTNHKILLDWPTADTGVAVAKFKNEVIGRIFISTGAKRPYTMRTVLYGTKGTIICDNRSNSIQISEKAFEKDSGSLEFNTVPVTVASHNVSFEFKDFVDGIKENKQCPTDVYQGTATVAFAEAALRSASSGKPEQMENVYDW